MSVKTINAAIETCKFLLIIVAASLLGPLLIISVCVFWILGDVWHWYKNRKGINNGVA